MHLNNQVMKSLENSLIPLYHIIPAVFSYICKNSIEVEDEAKNCQKIYGKIIQVKNALLYF